MKEGHRVWPVKSHVRLQDTERLPLSSLSTVPGLANGTQLCLMPWNNTTTRWSLGTAWSSQPAGQNSSDSDSGSNKAMLLLKGAAAAETSHFLCWNNYGFTRCHFVLQNGFRDGRLPGHMVNSAIHSCLWKEQSHQSVHTKSKGHLRKRTPQDCLLKLEKLEIHSLSCFFQRSRQLCSALNTPSKRQTQWQREAAFNHMAPELCYPMRNTTRWFSNLWKKIGTGVAFHHKSHHKFLQVGN